VGDSDGLLVGSAVGLFEGADVVGGRVVGELVGMAVEATHRQIWVRRVVEHPEFSVVYVFSD
jgi:hypothetical protein